MRQERPQIVQVEKRAWPHWRVQSSSGDLIQVKTTRLCLLHVVCEVGNQIGMCLGLRCTWAERHVGNGPGQTGQDGLQPSYEGLEELDALPQREYRIEYKKIKRLFHRRRAHPAPPEATSPPFSRPRGSLAGRQPRAAGAGSQAQGRRRRPHSAGSGIKSQC